MLAMAVHANKLTEAQRRPLLAQLLTGFIIPERMQLPVRLRDALGQGRIQNHGQAGPIHLQQRIIKLNPRMLAQQRLALKNVLNLIQELLGPPEAERCNEQRAPILQRAVVVCLEPLRTVAPVRMQAVTLGTFQHENIGALGWLHGPQQGIAGSTRGAREDDA